MFTCLDQYTNNQLFRCTGVVLCHPEGGQGFGRMVVSYTTVRAGQATGTLREREVLPLGHWVLALQAFQALGTAGKGGKYVEVVHCSNLMSFPIPLLVAIGTSDFVTPTQTTKANSRQKHRIFLFSLHLDCA
jgi:hypothetical protein